MAKQTKTKTKTKQASGWAHVVNGRVTSVYSTRMLTQDVAEWTRDSLAERVLTATFEVVPAPEWFTG